MSGTEIELSEMDHLGRLTQRSGSEDRPECSGSVEYAGSRSGEGCTDGQCNGSCTPAGLNSTADGVLKKYAATPKVDTRVPLSCTRAILNPRLRKELLEEEAQRWQESSIQHIKHCCIAVYLSSKEPWTKLGDAGMQVHSIQARWQTSVYAGGKLERCLQAPRLPEEVRVGRLLPAGLPRALQVWLNTLSCAATTPLTGTSACAAAYERAVLALACSCHQQTGQNDDLQVFTPDAQTACLFVTGAASDPLLPGTSGRNGQHRRALTQSQHLGKRETILERLKRVASQPALAVPQAPSLARISDAVLAPLADSLPPLPPGYAVADTHTEQAC